MKADRSIVKLRVREILSEKGMSIVDLAKEMGCKPQYVVAVVNGRRDMSLNSLIRIAMALDVPFAEIFAR